MAEEAVKQAIAQYWGAMATTFDDDLLHTPATEGELRAWDRLIARLLPPSPPRDVLDVGTGTGFLALEFARRGHRVTGIDLAPEMIARAREKAAALGLDVCFLEGDAEAPARRVGAACPSGWARRRNRWAMERFAQGAPRG